MKSRRKTSPRRAPSQQRSAETVDIILQATEKVLTEHGLKGLTTSRVARVAGVSVGTLYQYFADREALIGAVIEKTGAAKVRILARVIDETATQPLRDAIARIIDEMLDFHRRQMTLQHVMAREMLRLARLEVIGKMERQAQEEVKRFMQLHASEIRRCNEEHVSFLLLYAVEQLLRTLSFWSSEYVHQPEVQQELIHLVFSYVAEPSGPTVR